MNNPRSFSSALRRAWRSLTRRPGSFAVAVSSLAIALGLATTVIAQIDSLMKPYVPVRDPDQVYLLQVGFGLRRGEVGPSAQDLFAAMSTSAAIDGPLAGVWYDNGLLAPGDNAYDAAVAKAPPELFQLLGTAPVRGRLFTRGDIDASVALVSESFWKRSYAGRVALDAATFQWNGRFMRIVGVLPDLHVGPLGADVFLPAANGASVVSLYAVRVKKGIRAADLNRSIEQVTAQLISRFNLRAERVRVLARSLKADPLKLRDFHFALIGASVFILLIACANVSALMLARSVTQRRDQALRLALGAGARDLMRDIAAELTILGALGSVAGLAIGYWTMQVMVAATPPQLSWMGFLQPHWNPRVFAALLVAVLASVALAALIPAWTVTRVSPADPLKDASGTTTGRSSRKFQVLVVAELALSMVLLLGATLIAKTTANVASFDFGYDARSLVQFDPNTLVVPDSELASYVASSRGQNIVPQSSFNALLERVRATPGVRDASWTAAGYYVGPRRGFASDPSQRGIASDAKYVLDTAGFMPQSLFVAPDFMRTLGLQVVAGREFVEGDREGGGVILDETSAKALFPDGNAVGHLVTFLQQGRATTWVPVVGVVKNAMHDLPAFPEMAAPRHVYVAHPNWGVSPWLVVRPSGNTDITPAVSALVADMMHLKSPPLSKKWADNYQRIFTARQFVAGIFGTLSLASLVLATAGLFGVLSYAVGQRMREFAVRVALGARTPNIVRLVIRDGLVMSLGGTAIGGLIGMTAGFAVYDWLWGVYPVDAGALIIAEAILLVVTMGSAIGPAVRASQANPVEVMRAS